MKRRVFILSLIFAYILMSPYVVFAVSNIDQLVEEYTSDDYYEVSGQSIDIMEYLNGELVFYDTSYEGTLS